MNNSNLDYNTLVSLFESLSVENKGDYFRQLLRNAVVDLLKTTHRQKLMQHFYRLDLSEYEVLKALQLIDTNQKIDRITQLIFDRVIKKINTQKLSTKDN